jgi:hypothetical protein
MEQTVSGFDDVVTWDKPLVAKKQQRAGNVCPDARHVRGARMACDGDAVNLGKTSVVKMRQRLCRLLALCRVR